MLSEAESEDSVSGSAVTAGSVTESDTSSARTGTERLEQISVSTSRYDKNFLNFVFILLSLSKIIFSERIQIFDSFKHTYEVSGARFTSADRVVIYIRMCID